jgi:DNA-binding YbaB/EbfC family protein
MFDKMKQLMEMKKQADRIKKELDSSTVEANESGIKIVMTGSQTVQSVQIEESSLKPENKARFERDLARAVNVAVKKSQNLAAEKMKEVMPGFPGL